MSQVDVFCGCDGFSVEEKEIEAILCCLKKYAPWDFPEGMLSIAFLNDEEICRMHDEFLSDPSKTDVITFPGDEVFLTPRPNKNADKSTDSKSEDETFAGEICICVDQAIRIANDLGTTVSSELLLYLVHGWLHLAGLDDIAESDRIAMRKAEELALNLLREKGFGSLKTVEFAH